MQVEMWSLDRIKPYENNPRINDAAIAFLLRGSTFTLYGGSVLQR